MDPETAQNLIDAIRAAGEPHWLQFFAWLATVALSGIGIGALIYTAIQVNAIREANSQSVNQAKARVFLDLDARWESDDMQAARATIRDTRKFLIANFETEYQHLDEEARKAKRKERYCELLFDLREHNFDGYQDWMRVWGFLETLGYTYHAQYLTLEEITRIFGTAILQVDDMSRLHIQQRDEELNRTLGAPANLYTEFLLLADDLRREVSRSAARKGQ